MKKILLPLALLALQLVAAQATTVKTMFYNVLDFPTAPPTNRDYHLRTILKEYEPDIFMISELESEAGALQILQSSLNYWNEDFAAAPFVENTSTNWDDELQNMLYYRANTLDLVETDIIQTYLRDINMYKLQLINEDEEAVEVFFYVFVAHLKASQGEENEQGRLDMVNNFTAYLDQLPQDANVIFAGDFNLYSHLEPAYSEVLNLDGTNSITMVDPIGAYGEWHNNAAYTAIHTQSTRISNSQFDYHGAGGGLDDRFDFILISENLADQSSPVHYIEDSYAAYGNNGNCFNDNINDVDCSGEYSQELRNALYNMSDHLPVVLELETGYTLSLPQILAEAQIKIISGNVISEKLVMEIPASLAGNKFYIYNTLGQKMQTISNENSLTVTVDVSAFANGMYFGIFENADVPPVKFIKTR